MLINTILSALGRRKTEAVILAAVASGTAVGLYTSARDQGVASVADVALSAVTVNAPAERPSMTYLSAAVAKVAPAAPVRMAGAGGLPNLANANVDAWVTRFTKYPGSYATYLRRMTKYDD